MSNMSIVQSKDNALHTISTSRSPGEERSLGIGHVRPDFASPELRHPSSFQITKTAEATWDEIPVIPAQSERF